MSTFSSSHLLAYGPPTLLKAAFSKLLGSQLIKVIKYVGWFTDTVESV